MNRRRLAIALVSAFLMVAAATAQNASPSAAELLGEWNIVAMYGIDSGTVHAVDDAAGIFVFGKRGKGAILDNDGDTGDVMEFVWTASERDRTITISVKDSFEVEGRYTIQGNVLVLVAIQDETEIGVIVMTRQE